MSSTQVNYPSRVVLKGRGWRLSANLKKGPRREQVSLEPYTLLILRKEARMIQPVIRTGPAGKLTSLTMYISPGGRWNPLIRKDVRASHTSLLLGKEDLSASLQICQDPKTRGLTRMTLLPGGRRVRLEWIIDRSHEEGEELVLPALYFTEKGEIAPVKYTLKERKDLPLRTGRFLPAPGGPDAVERDLALLAEKKLDFDYYLLDYPDAPLWGDWTSLNAPWEERLPFLIGEMERGNMMPALRLAPLAAEKRSRAAQSGWLVKESSPFRGEGGRRLYPLDITRREVQKHLTETLVFYGSLGIRFFHLDCLDLLLAEGEWHDDSRGPLDRLRLLTRILDGFRERGYLFSCSLPLVSGLDHFALVYPFVPPCQRRPSRNDWKRIAHVLEMSLQLKNPPLLSMGALSWKRDRSDRFYRTIRENTQTVLNGPALFAGDLEDDLALESWKALPGPDRLLKFPLEYPQLGFRQGLVLLLSNTKRAVLLNTASKKRVFRLNQGDLGDSMSVSLSRSTSLIAGELIFSMGGNSSHSFQV